METGSLPCLPNMGLYDCVEALGSGRGGGLPPYKGVMNIIMEHIKLHNIKARYIIMCAVLQLKGHVMAVS